ncbi:MAG: GyrI-like domain-containing protein [Candidatus Bathyarchaeia archaeon]
MEKSDLRKELKRLYSPKERPELVDVPELSYLTYTGRGEPGGAAYTEALNALYSSVYTLKFASKKRGRDFTVMTLEGLWWWDDPSIVNLADAPPKQPWNWTSMIVVPDFVTAEMLEEVKPDLIKKKGKAVEKVRLERIHEGLCAQILHVGPYSDEPRSVKLLHGFMAERGLKLRGRHHEVYMSDPRRTPPEKWRTIIRLPVEA